MDEEDKGKAPQVPKPPADKSSVAIHLTVPIDKSMAKLKAHRKPPRRSKIERKVMKMSKVKIMPDPMGQAAQSIPRCGTGRRSSFILPIDFFSGSRKS